VKEPIMFHNYETEKITRKARLTRQKTCKTSCSVLPPEIVMQNAFSERPPICMRRAYGWKNRTTRYNCTFSAASLALRMIFSGGTTEQRVIAGIGELAAVQSIRIYIIFALVYTFALVF